MNRLSNIFEFCKLPINDQRELLSGFQKNDGDFLLQFFNKILTDEKTNHDPDLKNLCKKYRIQEKKEDALTADHLLQDLVLKKDKALQDYLFRFPESRSVDYSANTSPFERYEDLNQSFVDIYQRYPLEEAVLLPIPINCENAHLEALKTLFLKSLNTKKSLVIHLNPLKRFGPPLPFEVFKRIVESLLEYKGSTVKLVLRGCGIGDKEIACLEPVFTQNKIVRFDLSENQITDRSVELMAKWLGTDDSNLESLDLSGNNISDRSTNVLVRFFRSKRSVKLSFYHNPCSEESIQKLQEAANNASFSIFEGCAGE